MAERIVCKRLPEIKTSLDRLAAPLGLAAGIAVVEGYALAK
jgi:hypothetical protein